MAKEKQQHEVVVGNVGNVYSGTSSADAGRAYSSYLDMSRTNKGYAGGEDVTWFIDGELHKEHVGTNHKAD